MARKRRSPEEIAAAVEAAKKRVIAKKKSEGLDAVRRGRVLIFIVAALIFAFATFLYILLERIEIYYVEGPFVLFYLILGIVYYRNPFVVSLIAFIAYVLTFVLGLLLNPVAALIGIAGVIIRLFISFGLYQAVRNAKKYSSEFYQSESESNILDADFK